MLKAFFGWLSLRIIAKAIRKLEFEQGKFYAVVVRLNDNVSPTATHSALEGLVVFEKEARAKGITGSYFVLNGSMSLESLDETKMAQLGWLTADAVRRAFQGDKDVLAAALRHVGSPKQVN